MLQLLMFSCQKKKRQILNYLKEGFYLIAGIDEVGRGALCGPIVVAICILPKNYINNEINDSKKVGGQAVLGSQLEHQTPWLAGGECTV